MLKISEKLEEKNTSGTNRLSTDLSSNMTIYESARDKCCICLSGKHIFLLFPFIDMDLALYQSLGACSLHIVPKATACFSFSFGHSDSICYYALYSVEKAPVCLICNGCQGLGEMCFQLPLARMTDGKTIKHRTASRCVCVRVHFHPCATMFVCVQAYMCKLCCVC